MLTKNDIDIMWEESPRMGNGLVDMQGLMGTTEARFPDHEILAHGYVIERDPNGKSAKEMGSKLDAGKSPIYRGLLDYFPRACLAVADVSAAGAKKYAWKGWESVPDGYNRYSDALVRHIVNKSIEGSYDPDGFLHDAQICWNALAALELKLRK